MFSDGEINKQCARFNVKVIFLQNKQHVGLAGAIGQCSNTYWRVCEGRRASRAVEVVDGECFVEMRIEYLCARFI